MKALRFFLVFLMLAALSSCETNDVGPIEIKNGIYEGRFSRVGLEGLQAFSNVTLTMKDGLYTGESDRYKYPAICRGTYSVSGRTILFKNECPWTADFDWTYILSGKFEAVQDDNNLSLVRRYNDGTSDRYELRWRDNP